MMRDMASAYTAYGKAGADWAKKPTPPPPPAGPLTWETGGGVNAGMPGLVGPRDSSGGRVRELLAGARPAPPVADGGPLPVPQLPQPFLVQRLGGTFSTMVPNPEYGQMFGLKWDGKAWGERNPNEDLERELMELELEKRRKEVNSSGQADQLRAWLAKRLGSVE